MIQKLLFDQTKIVEVFGFSGVGKSALIQKVTNYLSDRNLYQGGIVYVNLTGVEELKDAYAMLIQKVDQ